MVNFKIALEVGLEMDATTLEDALTKARGFKVTDVVNLEGLEYNDGSIAVTGLFQF